jgi:gamma-glutamyltranspeptidase/glutathione hydrolase
MKRNTISKVFVLFIFFVHIVSSQQLSVAMKGGIAVGKEAMVSTAHPLASQAAIEMLKRGGNAVDAAVAAAFAIGVVEPDGSGIGGGGGMLIYLAKEKKSVFINYYQQTSENITSVNYNSKTDNRSAKAVTIPGTVDGLVTALQNYGTLSLPVVLQPAIRFAEEGFPVDETLAKIMLDNSDLLTKYESTSSVFLNDGFPFAEGDTIRQQELASALHLIAEKGRSGFYEGPLAEAMVKEVSDRGGALTMDDLKNYRSEVTQPVRGTYRGYQVISAVPPLSGATVIEALQMLENENLKKLGHPSNSAEALHIMAETMRRVYADRTAFIEDPNFTEVPVRGLTSKSFARARYNDINRSLSDPPEYRLTKAGNPFNYNASSGDEEAEKDVTTSETKKTYDIDDEDDEGVSSYKKYGDDLFDNWGAGKAKKKSGTLEKKKAASDEKTKEINDEDTPEFDAMILQEDASGGFTERSGEGGHTTHLCVIDKDGNAVSLTQTLGTFFGSGLTVHGILLNTSMSNFSTTAAMNSIQPKKRPRSSIAPTILLKDSKPVLVIGSPGAARIIATVTQVICNIIDYGMDAGTANTAPRFFCQKFDNYLYLESRFSPEVQQAIQRKGHPIRVMGDYDLFFGGVQLIMVDPVTGEFQSSADPRRGGAAIGY